MAEGIKMELRVYDTVEETAEAAAHWMQECLCQAVQHRGVASLALSGGRTPWRMLESSAVAKFPWHQMHVFQVDERAVPRDDGRFNIFGTKIFITYGEHDMADNIVHLVLARTPDAPPGTKGISCFIVPKFLVNADGSLDTSYDPGRGFDDAVYALEMDTTTGGAVAAGLFNDFNNTRRVGMARLLQELKLVEGAPAYTVMVVVGLIDFWLLYRFFSNPALEVGLGAETSLGTESPAKQGA